mgnify:CR=1 FL=1
MKQRILGLDTGTNSLGWAIVDRYDDNHYELVKKGVLIFQEGVKVEKGIESSKAAERTSHRALRRQYFRRRLRKIEVLKVLVKHNLCPDLTDEDLKLWHTRKKYPAKPEFMEWQRTSDEEDKNPYHCRYICTSQTLDLNKQEDRYILGRAMYHLAQRRGFLSNRLDNSEDNSEKSTVKKSIKELSEKISETGCTYLGEYFYKIYKEEGNSTKIRSTYTDRENHYLIEFEAICQKQNLPDDLRQELRRALYFQRPLKSQRQSVGKCTFEKGKARVSTSHYAFEEFRMLSFINNIRICTPYDTDGARPLNAEEIKKIESCFYRKSKPNFDFEDIAKAIAGKGKYMSSGDNTGKPYVFNYRMTQGVSGCPTIAQLRSIFGENWMEGIAETYTLNTRKDGTPKTLEEMADDIWNVLFFFDSETKLKEFATEKLQLDDKRATEFSKIHLNRDYASLSLKAVRNILPFLRMGMLYSHAVFLGNIPQMVGKDIWNDDAHQQHILDEVARITNIPADKEQGQRQTTEFCIKDFLMQEYGVPEEKLENLYHPSMIETYPDPRPNKDGVILLGSPRTNAVRNPMAMRSLHQLRKIINSLILEGLIDHSTIVHIEYARELNNANQRAAINQWQRDLEKKHKQYAEAIRELGFEPTKTDILKYQLWEEQKHICLYTGNEIGVKDFLGASPAYDIEHTIPQSVGGDSTQENMTLCDFKFNRDVKKAQIPSQLSNHEAILECIKDWKEKADELSRQIDKLSHGRSSDKASNDKRIQKKNRLKIERDYWRGKYERFVMTEVPEGFARRQGAGIGLVSKYAGLYLKSYFKSIDNPERRQIYSIKGATTAEFRKMWGIQDMYEKKSRDSHTHHCIDAIVIACIGKREYDAMGQYYHQQEDFRYGRADKPHFPKPWASFTEDLKAISEEQIVVHDTPDNMPKKASRKVEVKGHGKVVAKGDSARSSLHNDTYYGAIERDGEVRYVVRRALSSFEKMSEIENIVDEAVREKVRQAVEGKDFKKAIAEPIYMNKEKGILINKVRCFVPSVKSPLNIRHHRDQSNKEYKQQFHVANDSNYCMAIYEGEVKGKKKRGFKIVNMLEASSHFKWSNENRSANIVEAQNSSNLPWKQTIKIGTNVLLYESSVTELYEASDKELSRRLYKVIGLSSMLVTGCMYGRINLRHSTESRAAKDVKVQNGTFHQDEELRPAIMLYHTQFNALIEGQDFDLTPLGEIKFKK